MTGRPEVSGGVPQRRRIAAADVPTGQAESQPHGVAARLQALGTGLAERHGLGAWQIRYVRTLAHGGQVTTDPRTVGRTRCRRWPWSRSGRRSPARTAAPRYPPRSWWSPWGSWPAACRAPRRTTWTRTPCFRRCSTRRPWTAPAWIRGPAGPPSRPGPAVEAEREAFVQLRDERRIDDETPRTSLRRLDLEGAAAYRETDDSGRGGSPGVGGSSGSDGSPGVPVITAATRVPGSNAPSSVSAVSANSSLAT